MTRDELVDERGRPFETCHRCAERVRDTASLNFVITDGAGLILEASVEAAHMLNVSSAHLRRRSLLVFFDGERSAWASALRQAAHGQIVTNPGRLRPRVVGR